MAKHKRLAFLCHPYHRGGVTRWMADAAIYAAEMGVEVYFVTVEPVRKFKSAGNRERMYDLLQNNTSGVKLISAKVNFTFEFGTEAYRASIYSRLVSEHVPMGTPLIVSDDMAVWAAGAAIADKYPMVGVLHSDDTVYYELAGRYYAQMSVCACVSNRIRNTVIQKYPQIPVQNLHTIPCGIMLPVFAPAAKKDDLIRLIFIGRITDYQKRAEDLISICALLNQQGVAFHLDIAGNSDSSEKDFAARFAAAGVGEFVSFHGWRSQQEIQPLLNQADILLLTSNFEGMPLVMMEALASGCAFTGTRVSGIEDYENFPGGEGCLSVYTVGDIDDAVSKIRKLAAVPIHTRQLAAHKLAEAEFSMQACLDKYFSAVSAICGAAPLARSIRLSAGDKIKSKALALARYMKVSLMLNKQ